MSTPDDGLPASVWADAEAEFQRVIQKHQQFAVQTFTATSKDKMVSATVDNTGMLVGLKLRGAKFRRLSGKALCARILEVVQQAQQDVSRARSAAVEGMLPALGTGLGELVTGAGEQAVPFAERLERLFRDTATDQERSGNPG